MWENRTHILVKTSDLMNARSFVQGVPRNMTVKKADHNKKMPRLGIFCA